MPPHFPCNPDHGPHVARPYHRHKSIHQLLGGGKAADVLLWKDRNLSAGVLAGATLIWFLFDVVEYNIVPLLCQIAIFTMLVIFIASNAAPLFDMYGSLFLSTGFLCALTLPVLYQRYEPEVDHLVARGGEDIKKFYEKIDANLLNKIPRGPVKTKFR